jgi:hypothetical protein
MTVMAEDYDAGLNADFTFLMVGTGNPRQAFRIQPDGQVFTTVSDLDRENEAQYTFVVTATDKGTDPQAQTSTATSSLSGSLAEIVITKPVCVLGIVTL